MRGGIGIRQKQLLELMYRNDGRWPAHWRANHDMRDRLKRLLRRGLIHRTHDGGYAVNR
jgi:hypothetical protein